MQQAPLWFRVVGVLLILCCHSASASKKAKAAVQRFCTMDDEGEINYEGCCPTQPGSQFCKSQNDTSSSSAEGIVLKRTFEMLSYEFDKCPSCLDLWNQVLCAANCAKDRLEFSPEGSRTITISRSLCKALWDACSDDDTFSNKMFYYHFGGRRNKNSMLDFCENIDTNQRSDLNDKMAAKKKEQKRWVRDTRQMGPNMNQLLHYPRIQMCIMYYIPW